jgi:hypothetical protein
MVGTGRDLSVRDGFAVIKWIKKIIINLLRVFMVGIDRDLSVRDGFAVIK